MLPRFREIGNTGAFLLPPMHSAITFDITKAKVYEYDDVVDQAFSKFRYVFPKIVPSDHNCNICTKGSDGNCRRAHLELPHPHRIDNVTFTVYCFFLDCLRHLVFEDLDRAIQKVDAFRALRAWCTEANYTSMS